MPLTVAKFVSRWTASGSAERPTRALFLLDLCDVLGVPRPSPTTGDPASLAEAVAGQRIAGRTSEDRDRDPERAQQQANEVEAWWVAHRPTAPTLFAEEPAWTLEQLRRTAVGVPWPIARRPSLRRMWMPRTRSHVYFPVDEAAPTVHVLAAWGAPRGSAPKL